MVTSRFGTGLNPTRLRTLRSRIALGATFAIASLPALAAAPAKSQPAASSKVLAECSWNRPGHDKYRGDVPTAIDRYPDIPADVRKRLRQRMVARDYDDMVSIRRDSIAGKRDYGSEIRDMHFGAGNVCRTVTRAGWSAQMHERGMVYCDSGHCILVPTVCRNVSRITRRDGTGPVATAPRNGSVGEGELPADPPAAGHAAPDDGGGLPGGGGGGSATPPTFASGSGSPIANGPWADSWPAAGIGSGVLVAQQGRSGPWFETNDALAARDYSPRPDVIGPSLPLPEVAPGLHGPVTSPVPEPQSWALLAAGLALLGGVTHRRRRAGRSPMAR